MPKPSLSGIKNLRIKLNLNLKKKKPTSEEAVPQAAQKPIPRGLKVIERYPLYEPFAHVIIVQNPKTGEHKYILDELQLDPLERNVYNRILEILLAEIESPKEEIADPRKFFAEEAKKIVENTASVSAGSPTYLGTRFFTTPNVTSWGSAKLIL